MQIIYLDISNKGVVPTVYAKQGDVGRKFAVILTDSGLPYIPEVGSVFSVWYKGASGEGNYTDIGDKSAFSLNGNKVEVEMITQMLFAHGDGILCLTLNSPNGNQISSWNIPYMCEIVPGSESEKAEEYYTAFFESVEKLKQVTENLTPEAIGAAPAGHVDERGQYTDYTSALAQIKSVYASIGDRTKRCLFIDILNLDSTNFPTGSYFVEIYREWETYGTIVFTSSAYIKIVIRIEGSWGDFCYENPPMVFGTEYRTTERWNGKAVYTKLVDCGYLPNASHTNVDWGVNGGVRPIRWSGFVESDGVQDHRALPYDYMDNSIRVGVTNWAISLTTSGDYSMQKAYVQVWYTK